MLLGLLASNLSGMPPNERSTAAAHFVVGGVGQTLSAWLAGEVQLKPDELVDQLASLLDQLADPALYHN
jgi:hypothetical protein